MHDIKENDFPAVLEQYKSLFFIVFFCCWRPFCVLGLCSLRRPYLCLWSGSPPKVMWMPMVCAAAWSHADVYGLCCHWRPRQCPWPVLWSRTIMVPVVHTVAKDYINVCDLNCCKRPCWGSWSMLMDAGGHVDVYGTCAISRNPCVSSWSMLPLIVNVKEASAAVVSMTADLQLRMRDREAFCGICLLHSPPPKKQSRQKVIEENY